MLTKKNHQESIFLVTNKSIHLENTSFGCLVSREAYGEKWDRKEK